MIKDNYSELKCDDHQKMYFQEVQADRFCTKCNIMICNDCVLEHHSDHLKEAKNRIDDFLKRHQGETEELRLRILDAMNKAKSNNLKAQSESQENIIKNLFNKRITNLELIRVKIDELINEERALSNLAAENLKTGANNELIHKITTKNFELEDIQNRICKYLRDWDILGRKDKVECVKNEGLNKIKKEFEESSSSLLDIISQTEGNTQVMEKKLEGFEKMITYNEKLGRIDGIITEISGKIKDAVTLTKNGLQNVEYKEPQQPKPVVEDKKQEFYSLFNEKKQSNDPNYNNSGNGNDKLSVFKKHCLDYEYMVCLKQKSNEVVIFDTKSKTFKTVKITNSNFIDTKQTFNTFPDNSRYVNLGNSVLITGGYKDRQSSALCYLMLLSQNHSHTEYEINIMSYPNMNEARERHNILYLKDKESVMVCSGFFNENVEITNMNNQTWKNLPKLNDVRANAAMAYVNNRYIYCFSGFKINQAKVGQYLNSVDILDYDNPSKGWTLFNFESINMNLKLCAMGVIGISDNSMILCGGYDGTQYKNESYRVETKDNVIARVERLESNLPGNHIFIHNAYMRSDNLAYNYDLQLNLISYNPMATENQFRVI